MSTEALCIDLAAALQRCNWRLATAESCTGGMVAAACTDMAGAITWFERGFVTYSNAAKSELLGVAAALIARDGAVSESVARAMALGALQHSQAQAALAITGIAGPDGGSAAKPVGTVCFGWATSAPSGGVAQVIVQTLLLDGNRQAIREAATRHALTRMAVLVSQNSMGWSKTAK